MFAWYADRVNDDPAVQSAAKEWADALAEQLSGWTKKDLKSFRNRHYDPYWLALDTDCQVAHADLLRQSGGVDAGLGIRAEPDAWRAITRVSLTLPDHPGLIARVCGALAGAGYLVDTVAKGPEVLERAIVGRPDIILVKFMFAGMNGDAAAAMLGEMPNTKEIPIVLYDDSDADVPEAKFLESRTGICRFIRNNSSVSLVGAVADVLENG